jgi:hypothetical protein
MFILTSPVAGWIRYVDFHNTRYNDFMIKLGDMILVVCLLKEFIKMEMYLPFLWEAKMNEDFLKFCGTSSTECILEKNYSMETH